MRRNFLRMLLCFLAVSGCVQKKPFAVKAGGENPAFVPNTVFERYEDLSSPKFAALKKKYQLDTIFHGEKDEFRRILLLRHWIRQVIRIDNYGPYPGDASAESILDEALKGHGFHCGHYSTVMNAVMNGYGYITRCILSDVGFPVDQVAGEGHHAVNETWSNSYHKWVLMDAKYDYHFEKNGIPLSALDVRDEYLRNQAADIILVQGPDRIRRDIFPELKNRTTALFARIYTWLSWGKFGDRYTNWPSTNTDYLLMYGDSYFRTHTWLYNGKPHWAYNTPFMIIVDKRHAIEWTPNTVVPAIKIDGNVAGIKLISNTPNFKTYQMRNADPRSAWTDTGDSITVRLTSDSNTYFFRAVNIANVAGPEHRVSISRKTAPHE